MVNGYMVDGWCFDRPPKIGKGGTAGAGRVGMNVFLTIDVETYSGNYDLDVRGRGKGLDYILGRCDECGIKATFFVEAMGATQWGDGPLREICSLIREAGHDIQLHVHPVVARVEGFVDQDDTLWKHDRATQCRLIRTGLDVLRECGVTRVAAFRAGDLAADTTTLEAMLECGIRLGSNRDLDLKSTINSRLNDHFPVRNDLSRRADVVDLPVSALRSALPVLDGPYRHLQICAVGSREMTDALSRMASAGYACATILTHPGEFFRSVRGESVFVRKNCRRLEGLLKFLASRNDMQVMTLSECTARCEPDNARQPPELHLNLFHSVVRACEQWVARLA